MKRCHLLVLFGLVLLVGTLAFAPAAGAADEWCEVDPEIAIVTPKGNTVVLHVTNYGQGAQSRPYVEAATISHTAKPTRGGRETQVEVLVTIPGPPGAAQQSALRFKTRGVVSSGLNGTGVVYATSNGEATRTMKLEFTLPVP